MRSVDVAYAGLTGTDIDESTLNVSGTAGPRGATGAQGPQGATGAAGANGSPDTGAEILAKLLGVDGLGSSLDADTLDGQSSNAFAADGHTHTGATIVDGTIANADISPTAAIAESKLATQMGVMTGRVNNLDAAGPPVFGAVSGITDATATETNVSTLAPSIATVASRFSVKLTTPPGFGQTRTFTLRVNGSDTLSCSLDSSATLCSIIGADAAVPANAELTLQIDSSGAPAPADALFGFRLR